MTTSPGALTDALPLIALTDGVVLPDTVITVTAGSPEARAAVAAADPSAGGSDQLVLAPTGQTFGVLATIEHRDDDTLTLRTHRRVRLGAGRLGPGGSLLIEIHAVDERPDDPDVADLAREFRALAESLLTRIGGKHMAAALSELDTPTALADSIAHWPDLSHRQRLEVLETPALADRLRLGIGWLREALADAEVRSRIAAEVSTALDQDQRNAILRRQLAAIRKELGEDDTDATNGYRERLEALDLPDGARTAISQEIDRIERTGAESLEAGWVRTWLDTALRPAVERPHRGAPGSGRSQEDPRP